MTVRQRLERLEERRERDTEDSILILSGPDGGKDDALAKWMAETGKPRPRLFIYIRNFI